MLVKKFYNIKSIKKLYKVLSIVGIALLFWCTYFLFQPSSINQAFIIGTPGLMFLFVSFYAYCKEKKDGKLSPYKFMIIFNTGACILFLSWAVFFYCQKANYPGTISLIVSVLLAVTVYLKKYVNRLSEDNAIKLIEKYDKKNKYKND